MYWHKVTIYKIGNVVERKLEGLTCNHCCSGRAKSIAYYECVFVALGIQHELRRLHIICGLPGSTIFFNIIS